MIQTIYFYIKVDLLTKNQLIHKKILLTKAEYSIEKIADFTFENIINTTELRDLLKDTNSNTKEKNKIVRDKLHKKLLQSYNNFTKYNIQQLHFHLKNNESFLRFHKPEKFGDNLTDIRDTVKYVNQYMKPTKGFEEGRIFSGYRFVYPLFDNNNEHIGSVEISSSLLSFKKFLEKDKYLTVDYIMDKKVISQKVFDDEKNNYRTYLLNSNYAIRNIQLKYDTQYGNQQNEKDTFLKKLSKDSSIKNRMENKETFYSIIMSDFTPHIVSFIPLLNGVTNDIVGYIVFIEHNDGLKVLFQTYLTQLLFLLVFSIIVGTFIYKQIILKEKSELLSKKYKTTSQKYKVLLDLTENMVLIYQNNKIYNSNKPFLNFYNIENISSLKHNEITKYFVDTPKHTHPKTLDELKEKLLTEESVVVFMMNYSRYEIEIFDVSIHYIGEENDNFVLEFKDITELYAENIELEKKANYDQLTKLHNRHSFEKIFLDKFKIMKKYNTDLSLIMFDIDHFKIINDKHGHNVGDESLRFLSELVSTHIREKDTLCRWGGEEFMILMETDLSKSIKTAENLRETIYNETDKNKDIPKFSCSFGVISLNDVDTITNGIEKVDTLLYKSKDSGRNKVTS